jgi:hypothetical protein
VAIAIKPTSSIRTPRQSIDLNGQPATVETFGRHDPCVGIRATPIAEAMLALVLIDHALRAPCAVWGCEGGHAPHCGAALRRSVRRDLLENPTRTCASLTCSI